MFLKFYFAKFQNFNEAEFKIRAEPNFEISFHKILKFRAAEFPLSFHKRYILKFRRSRRVKFHAASKPLQTSAVARVD